MSAYPNQELRAIRKSGRILEAYSRGRELLQRHSMDLYLKREFGWVVYERVKQCVARSSGSDAASPDAHHQVRGLFREYGRLQLDRPDLLFSRMVGVVLRFETLPSFLPRFLLWAGIGSFREEDFQVASGTDPRKTYPPLIERLANGVGKLVVSRNDYDDQIREFALELIGEAISRGQIQDQLWLRYRKGQLLSQLGKQKLARKELRYVVREKPGEFWTWHALAKCEGSDSPKTAIAFCSKAYLVATKKSFAVGVLKDLVKLALDAGQSEFAKWAVDTQVSLRKSSDWNLTDSIRAWMTAAWYKSTVDIANPERILEQYALNAESILWEGTWHQANLVAVFTSKNDKKLVKIVYKADQDTMEGVVPEKRCPAVAELDLGSPLYAAIDFVQGRNRVMGLKERADGEQFDCLEQFCGILDHQNERKGLASVYLTPFDFCLLHYKDFEEVRKWEPGSTIVLKCVRDKAGRLRAYEAKRRPIPQPEWIKCVTDTLHVHDRGFGFVDDVYVPPPIATTGFGGVQVTVVAVQKHKGKDKSGELGWQAVSLKPDNSDD